MRKIQKEITNFAEIEGILRNNVVCRVAFAKNNKPYCVPMNYGYQNRTIYCHTGYQGLKMDFIRENPQVCVEVDQNLKVLIRDSACQCSCNYESIIAFGTVSVIEEFAEKKLALNVIMEQMTKKASWEYDSAVLTKTAIWKIVLHEITGKRSMK